MKPSLIIDIRAKLPENLKFLAELSLNLWWNWNPDASELFEAIDSNLWAAGRGNPVSLLARASQLRLDQLAGDREYLSKLAAVEAKFREYMAGPRWFQKQDCGSPGCLVAYLSAEYGLAECLPMYSGGLGILSGDHLKSASDLGLPLVGVGLAYRQGYFRQELDADGWQNERYIENDFDSLPIEKAQSASGEWLTVQIPGLGREVQAGLYRVNIGRVPLYLLSTNLAANHPEDQGITDKLYGGDKDMRIRQEIVLGLGGVAALDALGIKPTVFHMNEGHSAFSALGRIKDLIGSSLGFGPALQQVRAGTCFTTHTPVAAGNDEFDGIMLKPYLEHLQTGLGISWAALMELGGNPGTDEHGIFSMTVSALNTSAHSNGVSQLHGEVARRMWSHIWPGLLEDEIPIGSITNGVHIHSWIADDMAGLFDRHLGPDWCFDPSVPGAWCGLADLPGSELWGVRNAARMRLVEFARQKLQWQARRRDSAPAERFAAGTALSGDALTIGFARRFAAYKRAALLFRDVDRLEKLLSDPAEPVQIIIAGKAHPRDDEGKGLIRFIINTVRERGLDSKVVFLENYDIETARFMVQGCDVWLNTPRRPLEASGTSGMKAVANGGLHLSVPDGWWAEAYREGLGWSIGNGEEFDNQDYLDEYESKSLYSILESDVIPRFYSRDGDGLPGEWLTMVKSSMAEFIPRFSCQRMVKDYMESMYLPANRSADNLSANGFKLAKELDSWHTRVEEHWHAVSLGPVEVSRTIAIQKPAIISVPVNLGQLSTSDIVVEALVGEVDDSGEMAHTSLLRMSLAGSNDDGSLYSVGYEIADSGRLGIAVRVRPVNPDSPCQYFIRRLLWSDPA